VTKPGNIAEQVDAVLDDIGRATGRLPSAEAVRELADIFVRVHHGLASFDEERGLAFAAQWLAYAFPYRCFVAALADANAWLGADVDRYSFIVVDLHHLLLAGLPAHFESYMASQPVRSPVAMSGRLKTRGYSFIVVDLHHLLLAGLPANTAEGWAWRASASRPPFAC
jgi:hypothetical protein